MGYIDAELRQLRKPNDSSFVADFHLGKKYSSIKIFYSEKDFTKKELQQVSPNVSERYFSLPFETLSTSMVKLTGIRNQKGNAFARVKLTEIEKGKNNELIATLLLDNGRIRTIDSIAIRGYEKFPRSFLKYYAGIKKGKVFNKAKLLAQNENLNNLGFVSAIKPPEALFRKDSTIVYFYLEKANNNLFDGILGFATDEETQKLEFNGYLNLELNNNLNYGEQLLLNYKADGQEQIQFRVKAVLPFLFQTPLGASGELKIFKRDSSFVTTEQQIRTTYQISPSFQTYIGYRGFDSSNLLDQTVAGTPIEDFKSKFITVGGSFTKHQNRSLFPIKTFLSLDIGAGNRESKRITENQYQAEVTLSNIFHLNHQNSLFTQITTSALISDSYLVNELFRFGGINSIRGFEENSIDASAFSILRTEYRYLLSENLFIHSIADAGYFNNEILEMNSTLYSLGIGLGIYTKTGLFRFIIANGRTVQQDFDFSATKAHISITAKF